MKTTLYAVLLALLPTCVPVTMNAQVALYLSIPDPSTITSVSSSGVPTFSISGANPLVSQYSVSGFVQSFPNNRFEFMRHIYSLNCSDATFAAALKSNWPVSFPYYEVQPNLVQTGNYYPNDWGYGNYGYLDYIHAPAAWGITKGDSSTVIGITDVHFDPNNPDFQYKIKRYVGGASTHGFDPGTVAHGTTCAGIAAGGTDNGIGYPSVGFNTRLDLVEQRSESAQMGQADQGCQALSLSNGAPVGFDLEQLLNSNAVSQTAFQYIYEQGTLTVAAAGDGNHSVVGAAGQYWYPGFEDHVMSVSSVGWQSTYNSGATFNVQGVHETYTGDSVLDCYQHNSRVDILAPAIQIGGLWTDTTTNPVYWQTVSGWGTSFSAPMVAGTAALIHGENSCLSPYQLEWLIKNTANDTILSYPENQHYTGRLGAGALNTGKAVTSAQQGSFSCNDPATQTMFIQGVDLNTICAPGYSSNSVLPHLKPVITAGTAPYTARWIALPGNKATLSDNKAVEPDVTAATGGKLLYYRLTVYDSDPIAQKVADKVIRIQLDTTATYDLAMRDSYVDMLDEPNSQLTVDNRNWEIWHSPDLWARQSNDSLTDPQNPEYLNNDSNYVYVRIKNVGCAVADSNAVRANVNFYWTLAGTGEHWDGGYQTNDWAGNTSVTGSNGYLVRAGGVINTKAIPYQIAPGASVLIGTGWKPQKPQDYINSPTQVDVCLLARITETVAHHTPFGNLWIDKDMTFQESTGNETPNVRNNNNIVTRNLIVTNTDLSNKGVEKHQVWVANAETEGHVFNLQLINDRAIHKQLAGDFSAVGYITLYLGDLYDRWVAAGSAGTYAKKDETAKTVTFDGSTTLELDGISLDQGERFPVGVEIHLRSGAKSYGNDFTVHFRQFIMSDEKTVNPDVYGNVSFLIKTPFVDQMRYRKQNPVTAEVLQPNNYFVFPNPVSSVLNYGYKGTEKVTADITVTDVTGRTVIVKKSVVLEPRQNYSLRTAALQPGIYFVNFSDGRGNTGTFKITKVN